MGNCVPKTATVRINSLKAVYKNTVHERSGDTEQTLGSQSLLIRRHMCTTRSYPRTNPASIIQRNRAASCWQVYFSLPKAVSHGNLGPAPLDANSLAERVCLCLGRVLSMLCFCSKELGGTSIHRGTGEQARQCEGFYQLPEYQKVILFGAQVWLLSQRGWGVLAFLVLECEVIL